MGVKEKLAKKLVERIKTLKEKNCIRSSLYTSIDTWGAKDLTHVEA